ncbi:restriction endonuclease [Streptomyces sp. NRRL S-1521]|uniref:restriction endonuclease n=1 Tax=Streptomyces sp. NRRL S-1521 TaxID=1609100 RepID=UPI00074A028E|nr:restriction endonuclease [Streptomyces sp. NRRL S-1521]KUL64164.1 restriction endonuclease [Streptomyces sp. NRRL S-1521]
MTVPTRPVRGVRRERRFDLRVTTLFFVLLAVILCALVYVARTAAHIVESRPLWAVSLLLVAVAAASLCRSRWRRFSAARCARRATEVLEEAAERASDSLDDLTAGSHAPPVARTAAPDEAGTAAYVIPAPAAPVDQPLAPDPARVAPDVPVPGEPGAENTTVVVAHPDDYTELDPDGFEDAIAELCVRDACLDVEVVGGACDLGADVVAVTPDGRRIVIQCKRYGDANKVGSQDLQRFGGTCFTVHEADVAVLVTTSDFTAPALEYAEQCGIVCVDGAELAAWRDGAGPSPWERAAVEAGALE